MQKNDPEAQPFIKKSLNKLHEMLSPRKKMSFLKEDPEIEINGERNYLASFNKRILASTIDVIILSIIIIPLSQIISAFGLGDKVASIQLQPEVMLDEISGMTLLKMLYESGALIDVVFMQLLMFGFIGLYMILFWIKKGATLGKMIFKCRIVNSKTYKKISLKQAVIRFIAMPFSFLTLMIGFFMIDYTKQRQSLHDKIAGTLVIYSKKNI